MKAVKKSSNKKPPKKKQNEQSKKPKDLKTYMNIINPKKMEHYQKQLKEGDQLPQWITEEKDWNGN